MYTTNARNYEGLIAESMAKIEANKNNPHFFQPTAVWDMHDNGKSEYDNEMANIRYYKQMIAEAEKEAAEAKAKEEKMARKAEKMGMSLEAYKAMKEAKAKAKAKKAKANRYRRELNELNGRKTYLEKWLAEYEGAM